MKIGAQFYTIRDFCKDLDSLSESLKKVADIGYKNIQLSGVCEYEAEWMKNELEKNGLKAVLTHSAPEKLTENAAAVAKFHDVFGCNNVGLGYYSFEDFEKAFPEFLKIYAPIIDAISENGKYFMYHNHHYEFAKINGKTVMQLLAESFPADKMGFTLDTYWIQHAGADPALWLQKLAGRIPCIHLKDHAFDGKMAVVGEGNINFDRVFEAAQDGGTDYMLVEQDDCNGEDPFDCLKRSYQNLKAMGFN